MFALNTNLGKGKILGNIQLNLIQQHNLYKSKNHLKKCLCKEDFPTGDLLDLCGNLVILDYHP